MDERRVLHALEVPLAATKMTLLVGILDEKVDYVIHVDVQRTKTVAPLLLKLLLRLYVSHFPCEGYTQGMNYCAVPFIESMTLRKAFWAFAMFMGRIRQHLPQNYAAFHAFCATWEKLFTKFSGQQADIQHTLALKAGVFRLAPCMDKDDLCKVWEEMFQCKNDIAFTAAFFAAAVRRKLRTPNAKPYECVTAQNMVITDVDPLIRRAKRTILIYKL